VLKYYSIAIDFHNQKTNVLEAMVEVKLGFNGFEAWIESDNIIILRKFNNMQPYIDGLRAKVQDMAFANWEQYGGANPCPDYWTEICQ